MSETQDGSRPAPGNQRAQGPNETLMISSEELAAQAASAAAGEKRVVEGTPRLVGRSQVVAERMVDLEQAKTTVGRDPANDIVIEDGTVSARHAQIVSEDGVWRVVNLISTNGTSVNGNTAIVSYLSPGDVVAFGRVEFEFRAGVAGVTQKAEAGRRGGNGTMLWVGIGGGLLMVAAAAALLLLG